MAIAKYTEDDREAVLERLWEREHMVCGESPAQAWQRMHSMVGEMAGRR